MRILDTEHDLVLSSVLILLTPDEAKYLTDTLSTLNIETGEHIHVSDEDYQRELTFSVYTSSNRKYFSEKISKLIEEP
jgi:hypothetical protein